MTLSCIFTSKSIFTINTSCLDCGDRAADRGEAEAGILYPGRECIHVDIDIDMYIHAL